MVEDRNQRLMIEPPAGPAMDILHPSKKALKNFLELTLRQKVLQGLVDDLDGPSARQRKDMRQIQALTDRRTTLNLFKAKKSPIRDLPLKMFRRILISVISGSVRAGDRLYAAKLAESDTCEADGCRHTTHHLWGKCTRYRRIREEYERHNERILAAAKKYGSSGIAPADPEAA